MRLILHVAVCFALIGVGTVPSLAEDATSSGWSVISRDQPDAEVDPLCILRSPTVDGRRLQITNPLERPTRGRGNARINLYFPGEVAEGEKQDIAGVVVKIDGKSRWQTDMLWVMASGDNVLTSIIETEIDRVIKPLAFGKTLSIQFSTKFGQFDETFSLRGSSKALQLYEACLSKVRIAPERIRQN